LNGRSCGRLKYKAGGGRCLDSKFQIADFRILLKPCRIILQGLKNDVISNGRQAGEILSCIAFAMSL
jgi:hypothetical protein